MRIGAFEMREPLPHLKEPHVIAILRPWVNVGRVGTLTMSRLERHFATKQLGQLAMPGDFFDFTRYRPRSRLVRDRREMRIPNSVLSYVEREEAPDLLLFNLREPHAAGEDYVQSIVDVLKALDVRRYCLIGGMYDVVPHTRPLLVSGSAGGPGGADLAKSLNIEESGYQGPTSITAIITQEALKLGIDYMTLVVHLPQYVQLDEDYAGAARLMEVLCSMYGLPPRLVDEDRGKRQYNELNLAMDRNPELKAILSQLEAQYDRRHKPTEEPLPPLAPEVERFLREVGSGDRAQDDEDS
ncbi:MAG: PAC2 family protein [Dehalococcoidia bacterium]|nr:PAC2 family protein [Dehalococcoidia bacterium]